MKIELTKNGKVEAVVSTDADGKYDFFGVTPGDYVVQIGQYFFQCGRGKCINLLTPKRNFVNSTI